MKANGVFQRLKKFHPVAAQGALRMGLLQTMNYVLMYVHVTATSLSYKSQDK